MKNFFKSALPNLKLFLLAALVGAAMNLASIAFLTKGGEHIAKVVAPPARAGALSDYLENKLVDHVFRAQTYTAPSTIYVALFTSACSDSAAGTEVTGGSYARPGLAASLTNWAGTQAAASTTASSGTSGTTSNNTAITFATPTAGWGNVTYIGLMDAVTSGNLLVCTQLTTAKTINTGDAVSFPAASLTNQIDN